jgi:hypothetical protein
MVLVFQVLGFLAGGAVLTRIFTAGSSPRERLPLAGVGLAAALVASVLFWDHVWQIGSGLPGSTRTASAVSSFTAQHAPDPGANNAFLAWVRKDMLGITGGRSTYYFESAKITENPLLYQWGTYELLPGREAAKLSEADWIVFYEASPLQITELSRQIGKMFQFSPGYALALRYHAR